MPTATASASPKNRRKQMLDVEDLAKILNCSERHVHRMAESRRMPAPVRLGSLVRWDQDVVELWIEQGCLPVASGERRSS